MLRSLSRLAGLHRQGVRRTHAALWTAHRMIHNSTGKPERRTAARPKQTSSGGTTSVPAASASVPALTDDDYAEAMKNLKTIGLDTILNSALDQWGRLVSHGKPYIRPEIHDQWRKNALVEFVSKLCDRAFVEKTTKSSEALSKEIDKILVLSALALVESEDECVTILCPGAPHLGSQHDADGVQYTLKHRAFFQNDQGAHCLRLVWETVGQNRALYESQAELDPKNMMWAGTLDELFSMADVSAGSLTSELSGSSTDSELSGGSGNSSP